MNTKAPVLIIEDSPAVGMLLTEFMKKLGYDDVHYTETGKDGVAVFNTIIQTKSVPLIFLDYNLPDTTANSVMSQILTIKPYTKIIIETANSKDDEKIREVILMCIEDPFIIILDFLLNKKEMILEKIFIT